MNVGNWTRSRIMHAYVFIYFKCLSQICTKMRGSKFDFQKFLGRAHRALSPDPLRFFSSSALGSDCALNYQVLISHSRFGLRPQLSIEELGLTPKINSRIRLNGSPFEIPGAVPTSDTSIYQLVYISGAIRMTIKPISILIYDFPVSL